MSEVTIRTSPLSGWRKIVEIVFVVGNYTMLSMVANATGVPIEQRLSEMPVAGR